MSHTDYREVQNVSGMFLLASIDEFKLLNFIVYLVKCLATVVKLNAVVLYLVRSAVSQIPLGVGTSGPS